MWVKRDSFIRVSLTRYMNSNSSVGDSLGSGTTISDETTWTPPYPLGPLWCSRHRRGSLPFEVTRFRWPPTTRGAFIKQRSFWPHSGPNVYDRSLKTTRVSVTREYTFSSVYLQLEDRKGELSVFWNSSGRLKKFEPKEFETFTEFLLGGKNDSTKHIIYFIYDISWTRNPLWIIFI